MYNIHLEAYVRQLLPPHHRKPILVALLRTLFKKVGDLFTEFNDYRRDSYLEITATGQVLTMEFNLSRLIGLPMNYIYIADSNSADFAVLIPDTLTRLEEEKIRAYVEAHRLSGKSFEIVRNV